MKVWHLHRDEFLPQGVWGTLTGPGLLLGEVLHLDSLENPDTLFPNGTYNCVRTHYHRGNYPTFEIIVPGRTRILFHAANYVVGDDGELQLEGCVAPGMERGLADGRPAVWRSRYAHNLFMDSLVGEDHFTLVVTGEE